MLSDFKSQFLEISRAIIPITVIILIIHFLFIPDFSLSHAFQFIMGSLMVILGITLFLVGVNLGLIPIGNAIGSEIVRSGSIPVILLIAFLFGFFATVAEPDVRVLANMIESVAGNSIDRLDLILVISTGGGFFVAASILRIVFNVPLAYLFTAGYLIVLALLFFAPQEYVPIAFDGGGVTVGPVNGPIFLSLGIGVTSVLGGRSAITDGFGLVGFASVGSVIGILLMGIVAS
ncbi:DUF1538 domain-containing protein [Methanospirillum sp.]|uniref:DUF1538 domain-containing protein n=1 Tax=Methanospirillum sp. TaxID=45200 RepID=UPI001BD378CA|nr:DUF1538 domain-containing protein [Methanospirillum sp.]